MIVRFRLTPAAMASMDTYIATCSRCTGTEIVWSPMASLKADICSKFIDQQQFTRHRNAVVRLHRQLHAALPQTVMSHIYDFVFPTSRKQWKLLNGYNYMQRKRTFYFLLRGAPRSNNWIHDLHEQLHYQSIRYYSCSAVDRTDLYTTLYEFLT